MLRKLQKPYIDQVEEGTYVVESHSEEEKDTTIVIKGDGLKHFIGVNLLTMGFILDEKKYSSYVIGVFETNANEYSVIPKTAVAAIRDKWPTLVVYNHKAQRFEAIDRIELTLSLDNDKFDPRKLIYAMETYKAHIIEPDLIPDNEDLQSECQPLMGDVKLEVTKYPIFLSDNRPSYQLLKILYQQFIDFNDDKKLAEQVNSTDGYCHIRAHFVCELLKQQGIQTFKLYEYFNKSDWAKLGENKSWYLHCAAMIIDNENHKWVWDPWEYEEKKLLTISEWLNAPKNPHPIYAKISSSTLISISGMYVVETALSTLGNPNYQEIYGKLICHATPDANIQAFDEDFPMQKLSQLETTLASGGGVKLFSNKNILFFSNVDVSRKEETEDNIEESEQVSKIARCNVA